MAEQRDLVYERSEEMRAKFGRVGIGEADSIAYYPSLHCFKTFNKSQYEIQEVKIGLEAVLCFQLVVNFDVFTK